MDRFDVDRERTRGQGMVEFAMVVPVFMLILLGMLEFGFVFDQTMTISYATREGARSGAAFANGNSTTLVCGTSVDIDKHIVAAVQRVLEAPGSRVDPGAVQISIFQANNSGTQVGNNVNVWVPGTGPTVDGAALHFQQDSANWNACTRDNTWTSGAAPDSIGIGIRYEYELVTPLAGIFGFFGSAGPATMDISDRTVMALNPTND